MLLDRPAQAWAILLHDRIVNRDMLILMVKNGAVFACTFAITPSDIDLDFIQTKVRLYFFQVGAIAAPFPWDGAC